MDVRWITAFVDRPVRQFQPTADFWAAASSSSLSPWRGQAGEFATLLPADGGDSHLRLQRTDSDEPGSHLDLHVSDVRRGAADCTDLGAQIVADHGEYVVLTTPSGMVFCVVAHHGEQTRQKPAPVGAGGTTTLVDQVCIDADPDRFDDEVRFWSSLSGWPPVAARSPEFVVLARPATIPIRLLFQRRDKPSGTTTCHLDIACEHLPSAVVDHESLGAAIRSSHRNWTVMTDPSGAEYCLTRRHPSTGVLPPDD